MIFTPAQLGPDVSFYQDDNATPQKINFETMKNAGAQFTILRAGQNTWNDEDFRDNINGAKAAGLPWGTYWFYDSRSSPQSQVTLWRNACGLDIPVMIALDLEEQYGGAYQGERYWKECLSECKIQFPQSNIAIYTADWWWSQQVVTDPGFFAAYPLWVAGYTSSPTNVKLPKPWYDRNIQAHLWQYTAKGNGPQYGTESLNVDLNYWNALYDFNVFWKIGTTPPPDKKLTNTIYVYSDGSTVTHAEPD